MRFWYVLTFAVVSIGQADDCSTVHSLAKYAGPNYDQENLEWCHSLTTTDVLTQKMHRLGALKPDQRLHPFGIGGLLHVMSGKAPGNQRRTHSTVLANLESISAWADEGGRLCLEKDLGSIKYSLNNVAGDGDNAAGEVLRRNWTVRDGRFVRIGKYAGTCVSDEANARMISDMAEAERRTWIDSINRRCHTPMPEMSWRYKWRPEWTGDINGTGPVAPDRIPALTTEIDEGLNQGAMVAVEYKPDFMVKGPWRNRGNHWSSVVARERRPDGQCYYQIRNSWGQSCEYYVEPKNCARGYIWVKRADLVKHTDATTYLP